MAAEVAKTLELQKHMRTLITAIKARRKKGGKSLDEIRDEEIQVLTEAVEVLSEQMKVIEVLGNRLLALEEWSRLPWYKRAFRSPDSMEPGLSVIALPARSSE